MKNIIILTILQPAARQLGHLDQGALLPRDGRARHHAATMHNCAVQHGRVRGRNESRGRCCRAPRHERAPVLVLHRASAQQAGAISHQMLRRARWAVGGQPGFRVLLASGLAAATAAQRARRAAPPRAGTRHCFVRRGKAACRPGEIGSGKARGNMAALAASGAFLAQFLAAGDRTKAPMPRGGAVPAAYRR